MPGWTPHLTFCGPDWRHGTQRFRRRNPRRWKHFMRAFHFLRVEIDFMSRKRILIILLVAAILGGTAAYATWFRRDNALQGSGTVEARDIRVGSKVGGRIDKVLVREGDRVQPGQTLITFDDKELLASLDQSRAAAEKAKRGYRPEEIAEARAAAEQAKADCEMRKNGYRKEDIAAAESDVER